MAVAGDQQHPFRARLAGVEHRPRHRRIAGPLGLHHAGQHRLGHRAAVTVLDVLAQRLLLRAVPRGALAQREQVRGPGRIAFTNDAADLVAVDVAAADVGARLQGGLEQRLVQRPAPTLAVELRGVDDGIHVAGRSLTGPRDRRILAARELLEDHDRARLLRDQAAQLLGAGAVVLGVVVELAEQDEWRFGPGRGRRGRRRHGSSGGPGGR